MGSFQPSVQLLTWTGSHKTMKQQNLSPGGRNSLAYFSGVHREIYNPEGGRRLLLSICSHREDCYGSQISVMNAAEQSGGLRESVLSLWRVRRGGPKEVMCKLRPEE